MESFSYRSYLSRPPKGQEKKTLWLLTCSILFVALVCVGVFLLVGGVGLLRAASRGSKELSAAATAVVLPQGSQTLQVSTPLPLDIPEAGLLRDRIPYRAVVQIIAMVNTSRGEEQGWWGSGTLVTPDGFILTNAHVVSSSKEFGEIARLIVALTLAQDQPPEPRYQAEVVQLDQNLDIAVIRITRDLYGNPLDPATLNLPHVPLGDSDALQLGDPLVIIGYPSIGGETVTLTRGEVSGFTSQPEYGNRAFVKTSATIAGGNSGGLAVNEKGEMIGIPTQLGYGGDDQYADCRRLVDTNEDGVVDGRDSCIPTGGFINALRPLKLALPYLEAARAGQVNIVQGMASEEEYAPSGSVIFQDDFSNSRSGWYVGEDEDSYLNYQDGEYLIGVVPRNFIVNTWLGRSETDVVISVDAYPYKPTGMGGFGVLCRFQKDTGDYYGLEITEDGYSSIWRYENGEYTFLSYWALSSAIPSGGAGRITAACVGEHLLLAVDNMLVAEAFDASWASGDIGLFAETFDAGGFVAAFDNYVVQRP